MKMKKLIAIAMVLTAFCGSAAGLMPAQTGAARVNSSRVIKRSQAVKKAMKQPAAAYYGSWGSAAVQLKITKTNLTVIQAGQKLTTRYRTAKAGKGLIFFPTTVQADPLYLGLKAGHLLWQGGGPKPLSLTRLAD